MEINTVIFFELLDKIIHDTDIKVIAAEKGITTGGAHLEDAITHIENGNIKRTAAKIIDGNNFIFLFVKPVGKRRSRWLVDNAQNFKTCNLSRILCGVALRVVEIGRNSNDGLCDRLTEI